jgi:type II secretory pathway component PulM
MNQDLLNAHLRYQLQRHGWLAAGGLLLLLAGLAVQWLLVDPLHASNEDLRSELSAQRGRLVKKVDPQEDAAKRQAAFYATLPDSSDTLRAVAVLNRTAKAGAFTLSTGEYRVVRQGSGPLLRYQITVPLRTDYPHVRAWLVQVLNQLPNAALEDISLKRDDAAAPVLDAKLRLAVFMRAP